MSWIQKLYETYNNCESMVGKVTSEKEVPLLPICHTTNKAQIEIGIKINLVATIEKSFFRNRPEIRLRIVDIL